jgi:ABC-type antimicrobial peptide transport system permease subunit
MALGARPIGILSLILRKGMAVTIFGIAIGACAATVLADFLSAYLYEDCANKRSLKSDG